MPTNYPAVPAAENRPALSHKIVGDIRGQFYVAGYQRGYRWGREEVRHLLDDVMSSHGEGYSLQPVVVKLRKNAALEIEQEWELIDGQQRLTTLYLITRYMCEELNVGRGAPYTITYETRTDSRIFLETIKIEEVGNSRNIDYFHMHGAYLAIGEWFTQHGDTFQQDNIASRVRDYLFNSVGVIWYEAPANVEAIPLFTRLNVGRIPLTAAELVKAAMLTAVLKHAPTRAHEVAAQWDAIERDLHDEDIWAFVAGIRSDALDDQYPTRISLLLDANATVVASSGGRHDRYHTFDTLQPIIDHDWLAFWKSVLALHAQMLGWYRVPAIYNKIGLLVAIGVPFSDCVREARGVRKSIFDAFLVARIRAAIKTSAEGLDELSYTSKRQELMDLLLLMNIETATRAGQRFPFARHKRHPWSLEHIHAQQPEGLNRADQWKMWLRTHQQALHAIAAEKTGTAAVALDVKICLALDQIDFARPGTFSGERFSVLSNEILRFLDSDGHEADHSIRNMALLSSADNSRLNNSVFEVKRQMILELDRAGEYVPQCTRNVFLKYYADADAQQAHFWSEQDKTAYMQEIRTILQPYLS